MNLVENVKTFFKKKLNNEKTGKAPEGVCPNCWGEQEWEGEFFKQIESKNLKPDTMAYNSFISDITHRYVDGIKIHENTFICETCKVHYDPSKE